MFTKIYHYFDKTEDKIRQKLSRFPLVYAFIGGVGIVLFWRGVWGLSEDLGLSNWGSFIVSVIILLITGLFVSYFIGDQFIISGVKGEKKIIEKTNEEILSETNRLEEILKRLSIIEKKLDDFSQNGKN